MFKTEKCIEPPKQIVFISNTPFQVVTAICIRMYLFGQTTADLIITNQTQGYREIAQKAEKTGTFRNVICVKSNDFNSYRGVGNQRPETFVEKIRYNLSAGCRIKGMCGGITCYDDLFIFNWDRFTVLLYETLCKQNRDLSVHLYEEGITSYEHILLPYECSFRFVKSLSPVRKVFRHFWKHTDLYKSIRDAYVFLPEMLDDGFPLPIVKIPLLPDMPKEITDILFTVFDCEDAEEYLCSDIIFFEESYVQEGFFFDYEKILGQLAELAGKDRILIKRHPRSQDNTFEKRGFRVNALQHVPWELIVLRHPELCNRIWVSMCCSSTICPYYYLGLHTKSVFLFRMTGYRPSEKTGIYFEYIRNKLLDPHPEIFAQPESALQLKEYICHQDKNNKEHSR